MAERPSPNDRPNIVLIFADDMGYGDLGANNPSSKIPTPNLDQLAEEGLRFTDAHAASSVCSPSRYALLTGRYCWRTPLQRGVLWPWDPPLIEPDRLTVPKLLRRHGYQTACIGKWHLGWEWATYDGEPANKGAEIGVLDRAQRHAMEANIDYSQPIRGGPVDCGFDSYFGVDVPNFPPYTWFEDDHLTDEPTIQKPDEMFGLPGKMKPGWDLRAMIPEFVRRAEAFIERSGPEPFFLYFPLTSPHTPIVPNDAFVGKSGAGLYGDFVCEVDWVVGRIMAALEEKGIAGKTLLIFTSDNGPECIPAAAGGSYEHARRYGHYSMAHLRGVKRDAWEGGHRVPLVVRWPGVAPEGVVRTQLVGLVDLLATCADLLGETLENSAGEDSISALPLLRGSIDAPVRDTLIYHSCSGKFAIRQGDWVFIDAPTGDDNQEPEWFKCERGYTDHDFPGELFDLDADISQRDNRYGEQQGTVQKLARLLQHSKGEASPTAGLTKSERDTE
jgi:arylsulfatase A-like enzyme